MKALNTLGFYQERIAGSLERVLDEREQQDPLYAPVQHMLNMGGKRFRPSALLMACEAFGGSMDDALPAAVGVELFHNFTLMHDDLMDEAPLRRGKRTVHELYGDDMAVLAGDAMFVKAYQELGKLPPSLLSPVLQDFNRIALEVCEGQRQDMDFEERTDVSVNEYLEMIASKTGALLGGALRIGARIGGSGEKDLERMEEVGRRTGVAFQLQDDLMDVYADEGKFGKRKGGDILSEKKTYLLIRAYEKANAEQKRRLDEAFRSDDERKLEEVVDLYDELDVPEESKQRSEAFFRDALKAIEGLEVDEDRKAPLKGLVASLRGRDS